jgi:hypothetical protein
MFFFLSFHFFFSVKSESRKEEHIQPSGYDWHQGRAEGVGKGDRRANTVQTIYTDACKCKNDTC